MPPRPRTPKQPQDHKAKTAKNTAFTFIYDGKTYRLPHAAPYVEKSNFTGGDFMDAILNDDKAAEMRMTMATVEAAKDDLGDAYGALRSLPYTEFLQVVNDWMNASEGSPGK